MTTTSLWLIGMGPAALGLVGFCPAAATARATALRVLAAKLATACTVLLAVGTAAAVAVHGTLNTPLLGAAGIGASLYVDVLSAMMFCLVALIGLIVVTYSQNYLDGDPQHQRFMRLLCLTLAAVLLVIVSGNLLLFALSWIATSMGLHRLLVFYPTRRAALLAARKKFLASRVGDLCLLAAMILIHRLFGSLQYTVVFAGVRGLHAASAPLALHAAALLMVCTGMLKSAQFPLHGWLIEVMETPTPVSALLHAGIINSGGFLVLRFSDLISLSIPTLYVLAVVGGLTALFGSVVMLTQTSIKVSLAYSTIAQMGFMMLECGLGAFAAALLHILAHSLYKAHAFLSSGSVIDIARASWTPSPGGKPHPARLAISIIAVMAATVAIGSLFGETVTAKPGAFALGAVLVLALILLVANGIDERPNGYVVARTVLLAALVATVYFGLQHLAERVLAGSVPPTQALRGPLDLAIVVAIIFSFGVVTIFAGPAARPVLAAEVGGALRPHVERPVRQHARKSLDFAVLAGWYCAARPERGAMSSVLAAAPPDHRCELQAAVAAACGRIAPLWPLKHFVAVNPFLGFADRPFHATCTTMRRVARIDMLMPRSFYRQALADGQIEDADLAARARRRPRGLGGPIGRRGIAGRRCHRTYPSRRAAARSSPRWPRSSTPSRPATRGHRARGSWSTRSPNGAPPISMKASRCGGCRVAACGLMLRGAPRCVMTAIPR